MTSTQPSEFLPVRRQLTEYVRAARYLPRWRYVPDRSPAALLDGAS